MYNTSMSVHKYIASCCQLRGPKSKDIPAERSTPGVQTSVFKIILQLKVSGLCGEVADSRMTGAENIQDESGASCYKKGKKKGISNEHRNQLKALPMAKAGILSFELYQTQNSIGLELQV